LDRQVARLNIEHFRKLLATETDEVKRRTLLRLLAEEEAKLASVTNQPTKKRSVRALRSIDANGSGPSFEPACGFRFGRCQFHAASSRR
jgi:hypothetical protein